MLTDKLFDLITRLLRSRLARGYAEHHGACEVAGHARLGPLHLSRNSCFVLDHEDAAVSLTIPIPYPKDGRLHRARLDICYRVCRGTEPVRRSGPEVVVWRPQPRVVYGRGHDQSRDEGRDESAIPF